MTGVSDSQGSTSPESLKALLQQGIDDAEVNVAGDGRHFDIVVVSPAFDGLRGVKRQQLVYGVLNEQIASGAVHAVNMKLFTPEEWQQA